jgi:hypothetical protein
VRQIESEIAADAFRIYRPLAQWLEEGALRIVASEPVPATSPESFATPSGQPGE